MRNKWVLVGVFALSLLLWHWHGGRRTVAVAASIGHRTPVLVELFTSEGCSSCPPADVVLTQLERGQPVAGVQIIALGQHVDYWNNGTWTDRFSNHAFSLRQNDYAAHLHNDIVYTPQMIVDGQTEFVGSDGKLALKAISQAAKTPKTDVLISRVALPAGNPQGLVRLRIESTLLPALPHGEEAQVMLAVTEDELHSVVRGGENNGRTIYESAVVRQMSVIGMADQNHHFSATPIITIAPSWNQAHLNAVVFVQAQHSRRILGSAIMPF